MNCEAEDLRLFGITVAGTLLLPHLIYPAWSLHSTAICEGGCRFMAEWVKDEEKASVHRQRKREADEVDKVEAAPGVTVASLRRFKAALIGPTQGLPKRRRLCLWRNNLKPESTELLKMLCVWVHGCDPGRLSDGSRLALYQTFSIGGPSPIFF